jgi:class 3 adenylate cyclase
MQRTGIAAQVSVHDSMRQLAKAIPNSALVRSESGADTDRQVQEFIGTPEPARVHGAFRTIMFTDLVASTALTQRLGDDSAQQIVERHDSAVHAALAEHHGVEVKHTGDGIMAAFDSATDAARAAQVLVRQLGEAGVGVRVGLNAGEPIERDGDLFGTAVQTAARVGDACQRRADPGHPGRQRPNRRQRTELVSSPQRQRQRHRRPHPSILTQPQLTAPERQ